ncbi:MAG: hypothetical protein KAT20_05485, partial [Desulfuromonadales bacterium]|nr:hypothetical protein [Desulfuromonadales bacterium]
MPANQKIQYKKDIIIYLVNQLLQAELALNLGIVADQKIVDEYATGIHNQTNNVKVEQVKSYVRNEILVKMIVKQEVIDNITITDNELKTFYANNPDKFSQSESIHV